MFKRRFRTYLFADVVVGGRQQTNEDRNRVVINHHSRMIRRARRDIRQRPSRFELNPLELIETKLFYL